MSIQQAVDTIQAALAIKHAQEKIITAALATIPDDPFGDPKCNADARRVRRDWGRHVGDSDNIHADMFECVRVGDPTVQIGGK